MSLLEGIASAPDATGAYRILGADGRPIYVGKAKSIRGRLRAHFSGREGGSGYRPLLLRDARSFDFVLTGTETEALILENHLIKRHRPRYNVLLRDDKTYPSLRMDLGARFPKLEIVRRRRPDGALYFGPYPSAAAVRETLRFVHQVFPIRKCEDADFRNRARPCLYYDVKKCDAPCVGLIPEADYRRQCEEAAMFLAGRRQDLVRSLRARMEAASEEMRFEEAARIRDLLASIERTLERQRAAIAPGRALDAFGYQRTGEAAEACVLSWREGKLLGSRSLPAEARGAPDREVLQGILQQYYESAPDVPEEILLPFALADPAPLAGWLAGRRGGPVEIASPRAGEKRRLLDLAAMNARSWLAQRRQGEAVRARLLEEAQAVLGLQRPPRRIHGFDVSNLQGRHAVASRVAFLDGRPDRRNYRTYRIQSGDEPDDFRMMEEVVGRSLARGLEGTEELPDLVVVDGGAGQLGTARRVADGLGLAALPILGLAKGSGEDRVFRAGPAEPLTLAPGSPVLLLLQHLRDESHRFAIRYHRKVRSKEAFGSVLEGIEGLGPARRARLLKAFGDLEAVRDASPGEIRRLTRFPEELIERLRATLATLPARAPRSS